MSVIDNFKTVFENDDIIKSLKSLSGARHAFVITPSDTEDLPVLCRAIHSNFDGVINVLLADDTTPVLLNVANGIVYNIRVKRLYSTLTSENVNIVGLE